jgi:comEA protein
LTDRRHNAWTRQPALLFRAREILSAFHHWPNGRPNSRPFNAFRPRPGIISSGAHLATLSGEPASSTTFKEDSMFRTALTLAIVAAAIAVSPIAASAQDRPATSKVAAKPASTALVNINTASAADFEALPGIGATMAGRIVEYRQKNGPFKKIEDLMNVRGLGEKNFLKLKPQLTLAAAKTDNPQD